MKNIQRKIGTIQKRYLWVISEIVSGGVILYKFACSVLRSSFIGTLQNCIEWMLRCEKLEF